MATSQPARRIVASGQDLIADEGKHHGQTGEEASWTPAPATLTEPNEGTQKGERSPATEGRLADAEEDRAQH